MIDEEPSPEQNPCVFKKACLNCRKAQLHERPFMCMQLSCEEFTLCPGCNKNRTLHEYKPGQSLCKVCLNEKHPGAIDELLQKKAEQVSSGNGDGSPPRKISMTSPGTPPPELNEQEKEYYKQRWEEYKGHYRSPASYYTCHLIVLEEIHNNHLTSKMLSTLGEQQANLQHQRSRSVTMLRHLNDLLPEKEAQDVMDDEKALNTIYQSYLREIGIRRKRGISRILTPQAIALAPTLHFPFPLQTILERLGYKLASISEALEAVEQIPPEKLDDSVAMAEWFGFRIRQEYALTPDSPLLTDADIMNQIELDGDLDSGDLNTSIE